jgi:hypothetical protein
MKLVAPQQNNAGILAWKVTQSYGQDHQTLCAKSQHAELTAPAALVQMTPSTDNQFSLFQETQDADLRIPLQ